MERNTILVATKRQFVDEYLEMIIREDRLGDSVRVVRRGADVLRTAVEENPVCILMCMYLPSLSTPGLLRSLEAMELNIPVLCFCDSMKVRNGVIAIREGARGVVELTRGRTEVGKAIRAVTEGKRYIPEDVQAMLDSGEFEYKHQLFETLTLREWEVLQVVAQGCSNKEVANRLCITGKTVEKHKTSIKVKLGLQSTSEICYFALHEGLLEYKEESQCLFSPAEKNLGGLRVVSQA